jgi:hypothetical protein
MSARSGRPSLAWTCAWPGKDESARTCQVEIGEEVVVSQAAQIF